MSDRPTLPPSDGTDDRDLVVAAYVDGEATPEERARVEADPELLALADRFRAAKAVVADVPPLSSAKRESFLAAALAEHVTSGARSAAPAEAASSRAEGIPSIARPPAPARQPIRWLAVAAAALIFFAGGVIVAAQLGGGGDDDSVGAPAALDEAGDAADTLAPSEVAGGDTVGGTARLNDEAAGEQPPGAATAQDDAKDSAAPGTAAPSRTAFEPADESTASYVEQTTTGLGDDGARMQPPDDGQLAVIDRDDLVDWYERVKARTLTPPGAGSRACDATILGWVQLTDPKRNVVVAQTSSERLVAYGAPPRCDTVVIAQVP